MSWNLTRGGCPYVVLAGSNKNPHPSAKNALGWGTRRGIPPFKKRRVGQPGFILGVRENLRGRGRGIPPFKKRRVGQPAERGNYPTQAKRGLEWGTRRWKLSRGIENGWESLGERKSKSPP